MRVRFIEVVKDKAGWTVVPALGVTSSFREQSAAIAEAERICEELRKHGLMAAVRMNEKAN